SSCFTASGSRLLPFQTTIKCPNGKNAVQNTVNIKLSSTEDYDLRNPSDYLDIRLDCLDYDEQWGEAVSDASFYEMTQTGIFLNTLGGFAVWYLSPMPDAPSSIKFWDEGERDEPASIKLEARLVEAIECRMSGFERRIQLYLDLGGSLVYEKGGELPVGRELDNELLTIPHDHFMVELSQSQKDKIQAVFSQTEL
ncbi:hypothetical protein, partial [Deinococcus marmoris]|uniref:hypothetical protein n=1 Tax=Deinococcus marmoris TaxID=249408 RepID=UPI0039EE112B